MVETIRKKYEGFTLEQIITAAAARGAMAMMGHPTEGNFVKHVVSSTPVVKNCQITLADLDPTGGA
jgi:hypothetical protein